MALTLNVQTYDEALEYLIDEYGFFSDIVERFYELGRNDEAVHFARKYGFDIED